MNRHNSNRSHLKYGNFTISSFSQGRMSILSLGTDDNSWLPSHNTTWYVEMLWKEDALSTEVVGPY